MKNLFCLILCIFFVSLNLNAQENEKPENVEKKEAKESKKKELTFEGVVIKGRKGFYLKTDMDEIKLPVSKEEPDKFKFEDFLDKKVKVVGKGRMFKDKNNANFPDRAQFESISSITLVEEAKPEEKK